MTYSLSESLGGGSPVAWAHDWLRRAGFPVTDANVSVVYSWEYAESAGGGGMWNPLNTTQGGYPGETDANPVGVKNYVRRDDGLDANAKVIHNGFYGPVVAELVRGTNAVAARNAIIASPWGTKFLPLIPVPGPPPGPPAPPHVKDDMQPISVHDPGRPDNQQPFGELVVGTRQILSWWGFKIDWEGGGTGILRGVHDPHWMNIPGNAQVTGWEPMGVSDDGTRRRICVYGVAGNQWRGTAHA